MRTNEERMSMELIASTAVSISQMSGNQTLAGMFAGHAKASQVCYEE